MFCGGGFELSLVFRACFVGALLDRGLGLPGAVLPARLGPPGVNYASAPSSF